MSEEEAKPKTASGKEAKKSQSVDEAVKFYSKRWGVSEEEAAEKMQKFLADRKVPSIEEMFPEPLGALSAKVMEANQAMISTAMTKKKIEEIDHPVKTSGIAQDIDEAVHEAGADIIRKKLGAVDPIREEVDKAVAAFFGGMVKDRLEGKNGAEDIKEALDAEFDEFNEKMIKPLSEQVKELKEAATKKGGEAKSEGEMVPVSQVAAKIVEMENNYKAFLEKRGLKVDTVTVDKPEVEKMINEAVAAEKTKQEALRAQWEKESGANVTLESERIKATEKILSGVTDRVFDMFLGPLKDEIQKAMDHGAFNRRPPVPQPGA